MRILFYLYLFPWIVRNRKYNELSPMKIEL